MDHGRRIGAAAAVAVLVTALLAGCTGTPRRAAPPPAAPSPPSTAPPSTAPPSTAASSTPAPVAGAFNAGRPDHVVVVIFENKSFDQLAGNPAAPYLNSLMSRSAVFTRSYALTHPSQPNYLALFSGGTQGIGDDSCFAPLRGRANLGRQLLDAGQTFIGYAEGLPRAGYTGCRSGRYAAKHNPWAHFANLPGYTNQPYAAWPADPAALPTVAFVAPDMCNDMHDCSIRTGDNWSRRHLDPYVRWADAHNSLLIITFDEDDNNAGNRILTLFAGAGIRPGRYAERITHYRVLRTIEGFYGLPALGGAAGARPINDVWR